MMLASGAAALRPDKAQAGLFLKFAVAAERPKFGLSAYFPAIPKGDTRSGGNQLTAKAMNIRSASMQRVQSLAS